MMQMMLLSLLPLPLLCAWCLTLVFILLAHTLWCLNAAKTQLIRFACCSSPIADSANFKFTACSEVEPVSHLGDILNCDLSDYDDITCISRRGLRTCVGKQTAFFWLWSFHKDHANYFNISFPVWFCSVAVIFHWTTLPWSAYIMASYTEDLVTPSTLSHYLHLVACLQVKLIEGLQTYWFCN